MKLPDSVFGCFNRLKSMVSQDIDIMESLVDLKKPHRSKENIEHSQMYAKARVNYEAGKCNLAKIGDFRKERRTGQTHCFRKLYTIVVQDEEIREIMKLGGVKLRQDEDKDTILKIADEVNFAPLLGFGELYKRAQKNCKNADFELEE